jgi:hypothetical protein
MNTHTGFNNTQRDVIFTYMFFTLIFLSGILVYNNSVWWGGDGCGGEGGGGGRGGACQGRPISVLDLWALLDSFIFSILLLGIMYLKLALYDLRRSDIRLLHTAHYKASEAHATRQQSGVQMFSVVLN